MNNKSGFTLIELLAVVVILGIVLNIAVPSVNRYIISAKRESFLSSAKFIVDSVRKDVSSEFFPLPVENNEVTIVTLDRTSMETSTYKSSFGGEYVFNKSYVAIVNVGTPSYPVYKYFIATQDSGNHAIPLTEEEKMSVDKVIANAKNKMEITVQPLCGLKDGSVQELPSISGLDSIQPVDINGNKINWIATIFSVDGCGMNE